MTFFVSLVLHQLVDIHVSADVIPSENECRPYIEKVKAETFHDEHSLRIF